MSPSMSIAAPGIHEFTVTSTTVFLEANRLCLYLNLWSCVHGAPAFEWSKHAVGKGRTVRIGRACLEVSWS